MKIKGNILKRYLKYALIGIATGTANGLFGSGGGTIAVPAMVLLLDTEEQKAHATAISIILPLSFVSTFLYLSKGYVKWDLVAWIVPGGIVGGYFGARLLKLCPDNILRKIFGAFIILAALRMIL